MEVVATPELMRDFAEKAAIQARTAFSAKLDFTPRSIRTLEHCLGMIYTFLQSPENTWTEAQVISFARLYGGYLGEVVKRLCGGEWKRSPIDRSIFEVAGVECAPCDKVMKRIRDGANDNVQSYFEALTQGFIPAAKGQPMPTQQPEPLPEGVLRIFHSSDAFSMLIPMTWKHYERNGSLSCHPASGVSLLTLTGNKGYIPFENFVSLSLQSYSEHVSAGPPRQVDGQNAVGQVFEFTKTVDGKTTCCLAYCLQSPTYAINASMMTMIPITDAARRAFDSLVRSVDIADTDLV
jgi:hypothetical protein